MRSLVSPPRLLTVLADVGAAEGATLLAAELARRGDTIVERLEHEPGDWRPAVEDRLAEQRGWHAFTLHEAPPLARAPPSTVISQHFGAGGHWDPAFTRALSDASGGFAMTLEQRAAAGTFALGVTLAGRTIEHATFADWDSSWASFCALFESICESYPSALEHPEGVPGTTLFVSGAPDGTIVADIGERPLSRALLARTDATTLRAAATPPAGRMRLLERQSLVTDEPYVLLEPERGAAIDPAWLTALAAELDVFAAALHLPVSAPDFTWTLVDARHGVRTGRDHGAVELVRICAAVTSLILGQEPSIFRWPADQPGELLVPD